MDFQFSASAGDHHSAPFPDPSGSGSHHRPLLPIPISGGGYHSPRPPNTEAAYFPAPVHARFQPNQIPPPHHTFPSIPTTRSTGFPGDAAAGKLRKSQIRAEILTGESEESRMLEEEIRRELYFERCMAKRLREVERLGLFTPAPGNKTPPNEIEGSIAASMHQLKSFGLILPSLAVEPIRALNYMDFLAGNMSSHPISHSPEARVWEMPLPDDNPQVGEKSLSDTNFHPIEAWVGERPLPNDNPQVGKWPGERSLSDTNFHPIEAGVGERPLPNDNPQVGKRPLSDTNFHSIEAWVGKRPLPNDNPQVGERPLLNANFHSIEAWGGEMSLPDANFHPIEAWVGDLPPPDLNLHSLEARVGEKRTSDAEIGETLPFPHNNLSDIGFVLKPPGDSDIGVQHESETISKRKRDRAARRKLAKIKIRKLSGRKATSGNCFQCGQPGHRRANCPASEEVADYKISQQTDENTLVEENSAAIDKCSRCGQSGHSRANCQASEEEAEWYKFTQEISDTDEGEVSEAHAPPANDNCFHYGEVGHQHANCPLSRDAKKQKNSHQMRRSNMVAKHNSHVFGASNHISYGCSKIGHMMRECSYLKKQIGRAERAKNMKHKVLGNGVDPAPIFGGKCFICGQSGHLRKQCPASREKVARFEDSLLGKKDKKKKRKKEKKAGR